MSGLRYLRERCYHELFESLYTKLQQLAHYFLYYSIIVAKQPPSVVVKCGEAENHRRSRFWFNTEIRYYTKFCCSRLKIGSVFEKRKKNQKKIS